MPVGRVLWTVLAGLLAVVIGVYQLVVHPKLVLHGQGRIVESINNKNCKTYPELQACEKLVIYEPNGHVYLACSTMEGRRHWMPGADNLNATGRSVHDYVATFNPDTRKITKLKMEGFKFPRGVTMHGMDVATSQERPGEVIIYLINHRPPLDPDVDAHVVGADSVIELFGAPIGGKEMEYVTTFRHEVIETPNDIAAVGDDQSFYFTNDHGSHKTDWQRKYRLDVFFELGWSNVGFCNASGCKVAASNLVGANGIVKGKDGLYYVGAAKIGRIYVLEPQEDHSLVLVDVIQLDRPVDNLTVDKDGAIWAAGIVDSLKLVNEHFKNPYIKAPSSALRITLNKNGTQYYGEKYKVEKVFEDDGEMASAASTVAYDPDRKKLYLTGLMSPALTVCDL